MNTLGFVFALMVSVSATNAGPVYKLVDLGLPSNSRALGINNQNEVVGCFDLVDGETRLAFLFSDGEISLLSPTIGTSEAHSINDLGQVAGWNRLSGQPNAMSWQNGSSSNIHQFGDRSLAKALNINGEIVGQVSIDGHTRAFRYSVGSMSVLPDLGGAFSSATSINSNGDIAGFSVNLEGLWQACIWQEGNNIQNLGTLGGEHSEARDINDRGQTVGYAFREGGNPEAFLWSDGSMMGLGSITGISSSANAVNENGSVVGWWSENDFEQRAFLYQEGTMYDLTNLLEKPFGWTLAEATDINDNGNIVGWGYDMNGNDRAFLLYRVPTPSSVLVLSSLPLLLQRKR